MYAGSENNGLLGSTKARMYKTPSTITADQHLGQCCLAWGGVYTHHACPVLQWTEKKRKRLVFCKFQIKSTGYFKTQNPPFEVFILNSCIRWTKPVLRRTTRSFKAIRSQFIIFGVTLIRSNPARLTTTKCYHRCLPPPLPPPPHPTEMSPLRFEGFKVWSQQLKSTFTIFPPTVYFVRNTLRLRVVPVAWIYEHKTSSASATCPGGCNYVHISQTPIKSNSTAWKQYHRGIVKSMNCKLDSLSLISTENISILTIPMQHSLIMTIQCRIIQ